jgi:hypothetical protein
MTEEGTSSDNDGAGGSSGIVRAGRIADIAGIEGPGLSKDRAGARGSAGIAEAGTSAGIAEAATSAGIADTWISAIITLSAGMVEASAGIAEFEGAAGIAEAERVPVGAAAPASAGIAESGYKARPGSFGAIFSISPLFSTSLIA